MTELFCVKTIAFFAIALGLAVGKIHIKGISLGPAGVLLVSVLAGLLVRSCYAECIADFKSDMKMLASIGSSLFVSAIGISTGYSIDFGKRGCLRAFFGGGVMVASAFAVAATVYLFDSELSAATLAGVLCGALTTTPGLSAVCELGEHAASDAVIGYGASYLWGVLITVIAVQLCGKKFINECYDSVEACKDERLYKDHGIAQIGLAAAVGTVLGRLSIPILGTALGSTAGILLAGIAIGKSVIKFAPHTCADKTVLTALRTLGLGLFFVGNGIPAGIELYGGLHWKLILYGIIMTVVPILTAALLTARRKERKMLPSLIAGGMTSTPAFVAMCRIGVEADNETYALSYTGALVSTVVMMRLIGSILW